MRVELWQKEPIIGRNELRLAFWFNTAFVVNYKLRLEQHELDVAHKDSQHLHFPEGFYVDLIFDKINTSPSWYPRVSKHTK